MIGGQRTMSPFGSKLTTTATKVPAPLKTGPAVAIRTGVNNARHQHPPTPAPFTKKPFVVSPPPMITKQKQPESQSAMIKTHSKPAASSTSASEISSEDEVEAGDREDEESSSGGERKNEEDEEEDEDGGRHSWRRPSSPLVALVRTSHAEPPSSYTGASHQHQGGKWEMTTLYDQGSSGGNKFGEVRLKGAR
jgi:hypothetical protein